MVIRILSKFSPGLFLLRRRSLIHQFKILCVF
jgi:hypothetical protein